MLDFLVVPRSDGTIDGFARSLVARVDMPPPGGVEATVHLRAGGGVITVPAAAAAQFLEVPWPDPTADGARAADPTAGAPRAHRRRPTHRDGLPLK